MKILRTVHLGFSQQSGCHDQRVPMRVNQIALGTAVMLAPAAVTLAAPQAKEKSSSQI
jgi:hypothetical protein